MNRWACIVVALCLGVVSPGASAALAELKAFQTPDGALVVQVGQDLVDPYFANKALIIATEAGVDVRAQTRAWLDWLLPRQRADGGFDRFCGARTGAWRGCMAADADDSTAATTIHLLRLAQGRNWLDGRQSAQARVAERGASAMLSALHDPGNGLYRVFAGQPVYYLMDNLEVYDALQAQERAPLATALAGAIRAHFRGPLAWQPAIPDIEPPAFYPHALARTYLWSSGILSEGERGADIANWLAQYSDLWIGRHRDPFAWGIVAWNIHAVAPAEAACWRTSVRLADEKLGWTVLDAAADAALAHQGIAISCSRRLSLLRRSEHQDASA